MNSNLIYVSITEFIKIDMTDCLNYSYVNARLENLVKSAEENFLKKHPIDFSKQENIQIFLEQMLLKLSTSSIWTKAQKEKNLSQAYLYIIIRKHLFLLKPELKF